MDGKRTGGWFLTRNELAIAIGLVLVACAVAFGAGALYGGLPPRKLVRGLIGLLAYPGLFVLLVLFVDSMLRIFGGPDHGNRTRGWYWTRIELAIGIGAAVLLAFAFVAAPGSMGYERQWWETPLTVASFVGMLVGLVWMIRIYRGPRDEPPRWRYRDR